MAEGLGYSVADNSDEERDLDIGEYLEANLEVDDSGVGEGAEELLEARTVVNAKGG